MGLFNPMQVNIPAILRFSKLSNVENTLLRFRAEDLLNGGSGYQIVEHCMTFAK